MSRPAHRASAQPPRPHRTWRRLLGVTVAAATFVLASGVAHADNVYNTIDGSIDAAAEAMALTVGGANGATTLKIDATGGDGKPGCNLTGSTSLGLTLTSSNPAVATVSPASVTFGGCGEIKNVTVTPVAAGTATMSATQTSNNTGGTFDLAPATFTVTVGGVTPPPPPVDTTPPAQPTIDLIAASDSGTSSNDNLTNDTTPTLSGGAEAASTVEVFDGGTSLGTTTATSSGVWTFTPAAALGNGAHSFTAKAKDAANNTSVASAPLSVTIDSTIGIPTINLVAASDTGTSNVDNVTSDNTPTLDGAAKASSTVDVFDGTTFLTTTTANSSGAWTLTTGVLADGVHNLTAQATDAAGNISQASLTLTVTTDTVAPTAPSIDLAATSDTGVSSTDDLTNDATPELTGAAEKSSTVEVFDGGTSLGTVTADATTGAWTLTTATLSGGGHTFTAKATDKAGNTSAASTALSVTVDTTAPVKPTIDLVAASDTGASSVDNVTSDNTPTLNGSAENGSSVKVYDGTTLLDTVTAGTGDTWTVTTGILADGVHTLTAKATDAAGNTSEASLILTIETDTATPAAPSIDLAASSDTGVSSSDHLTNDTTPTLTGVAENGSKVEVFEGTTSLGTTTANATTGAWSVTTGALGAGQHVLTAKATDEAGNTSVASSGLTVTIDTTTDKPLLNLVAASDTGTSNTDDITSDNTPDLDGTAEAGATVKVYDGSTLLETVTAGNTGVWSTTVSQALADGVHNLVAKATDPAGNQSEDSLILTIKTDTLAPAAPSIDLAATSDTGVSSTDDLTNDTTPTLTGSAEDGSTVKVYEGSTPVGSVTADSSGWSLTTAALADGAHVFSAKATDEAGNTSVTSSGLTVTIDTVTAEPLLNLVAASDTGKSNSDDITSDSTPTLDGTAEVGATVEVWEASTLRATATALADGTWSTTLVIALADGTHVLTAKATDKAGNTSTGSLTLTITTDTVAPAAPSIDLDPASDSGSSSTDNVTNDTTPTLNGSAEDGSVVAVYDDTTLVGTATAGSSGWSVTTGALGAGQHVLTAKATDEAGNTSVASSGLTVTIDTTTDKPLLNLVAASDTGTSNTDDITSDNTPDLDGTAEAGATVKVYDGSTLLETVTAGNTGVWSTTVSQALADGVHNLVAKATDPAGNGSTQSETLNVTLDTAAPTVTLGSSIADGVFYYYGSVPSQPSCGASDGTGSGLVGTCAVAGYGTTVGGHTVTATAVDVAGNQGTKSASYTVKGWTGKGFYSPVDMGGIWNTVKNGSTVPMKFEIFAAAELTSTSAVQSFTQKLVSCAGVDTALSDAIEVTTTGGTVLRYDATAGQFIQNWQTPKKPNTCYVVTMTTQDGSSISANFMLK